MQLIIDIIKRQGVPVDSFVAAGIHCSQLQLSKTQYESRLSQLVDCTNYTDVRYSKFVYAYLVQDIIKKSLHDPLIFNLQESLQSAIKMATTLIEDNIWLWAEVEGEEKVDDKGNAKHKRGWKLDRALELFRENKHSTKAEIMKIFQDELDMTKAGSQTYYYNMKKKSEGTGT